VVLAGVEVQPAYAALARQNAEVNGIGLEIFESDIATMPEGLRARTFDHVMMNPPYYRRDGRTPAVDAGRETALGEVLPLSTWVEAAVRRLKPGGRLTVIQRAERLADLIAACTRLGGLEVRPLAPRDGRAATLVILTGTKGGRGAFRLHAPTILHDGARHETDGESYRPEIRKVLRNGAALFG
jgi:tRNA1(Val) A37 N6-methylase TrmN6